MPANVAPLAGAWIEIMGVLPETKPFIRSLPSRERGLKFLQDQRRTKRRSVAPLAGAWIEMESELAEIAGVLGRSPRGSVD